MKITGVHMANYIKIIMKSIDDFVKNTATFILVSSRDQRQTETMPMKS